jgi:hypothetical protein
MTIKQQGGIFGRNPTFNDVTVNGTLTSSSISLSALDNVPIGSTTASTGDFTDLTVTQEIELQMSANAFGATTSSGYILRTGSGGSAPFTQAGALVYQPRISTTDGRSNHKFYTGSPLALALDLKPDQNAHFGGNAVFASGNGIDFSATAGTGTSELFDDYEEGSFTPVFADASSSGNEASPVTANGYYTKIGRQVHIVFELVNVDTSGLTAGNDIFITGLPFAPASLTGDIRHSGTFTMTQVSVVGTDIINVSEIRDNLNYLKFRQSTSGDFLTVGEVTSGTADFYVSLTYIA